MALARLAQRGPQSGDHDLDRNRDAWRLLFWVSRRGRACQAGTAVVEAVLAVRGSGMFDPCVCHHGLGCAVQWGARPPCNDRNVCLHRVLLPMQAKASDQEDRRARRAKRSSRSSTRTANGIKRQAEFRLYHAPKLIDILFNSFTCDAVPGLSGSCGNYPARLTPTE